MKKLLIDGPSIIDIYKNHLNDVASITDGVKKLFLGQNNTVYALSILDKSSSNQITQNTLMLINSPDIFRDEKCQSCQHRYVVLTNKRKTTDQED
jgi:hypothetical protein